MHRLFHDFAHRYDLHTPAHHYKHDHQWLIDLALERGPKCRVLDIGCGTGSFLEKARLAGIDAVGVDSSPEMIQVATARLGPGVVRCIPMEELEDLHAVDLIVSLSWTLNYCADVKALQSVLYRCWRALRPGGRLIAQIAHAAAATGDTFRDEETGPNGLPKDVVLSYSFTAGRGDPPLLEARYEYSCISAGEHLTETHYLHVADARIVEALAKDSGFNEASLLNAWGNRPFEHSISPWLVAEKPSELYA